MAETEVLTATEQYGKAVTAFNAALKNAALQREQAMLNLGADVTTMTGDVLTPADVADRLAPKGIGIGKTKSTVGFGEGKLPTIQKEGTAATYEAVTQLGERGVGSTSGLAQQQRVITGEAAALSTQQATQEALAEVAAANAEQVTAKTEELSAKAALETAKGNKIIPKKKPVATTPVGRGVAAARATAAQAVTTATKPKPTAKKGGKK